ncbi:MAG: hypothetical protein ABIQ55_09165 [Gemmatimonadaceae bacterium]
MSRYELNVTALIESARVGAESLKANAPRMRNRNFRQFRNTR